MVSIYDFIGTLGQSLPESNHELALEQSTEKTGDL
jgi:hypothetical protein